MNRFWMLMLCTACTGEKQEEELISYINGTITPDHPSIVTSGEMTIYKAFAFNDNGTFLAYLSSNPEAHCGDVTQYLNDGAFDPVEVLSPGKCNITIKLDWTACEDDSTEGCDSFTATDDRILSAASSIECAMGEGVFEYRKLDDQDRADYYWTGDNAKWWQGSLKGYVWDISGVRGEGYTLDLNMYEYDGAFIHEEFDKYDATGSVQGIIEAYTCEGLASTGLFTG
jgi:hypothetical protein